MASSIVRETIYAAFFALVSGDATFKTKSRLWQHWSDVPAELQPALFMTQVVQAAKADRTGIPTIWELGARIYLYANVGQQSDGGKAPAQILNPLVDKICDLIQPAQPGSGMITNEQTLGGLVTKCRISGDLVTDEGLLGPQGVVMIPVKILVAGNA